MTLKINNPTISGILTRRAMTGNSAAMDAAIKVLS
jgi:hypothetical protein